MIYTIPLIPPSDNKYKGRQNVWAYRKDKKEWLDIVASCCRPKPKAPIEKSTVTITYFFGTKHRHDPDNYSGKFILDGLVQNGIIADDSFNHIELKIRGEYDKLNPRTEIRIQEETV